jgi:hypothetical protein
MRNSLFILFFPTLLLGQTVSRNLLKANSIFFRDHIYVYGFVQDKSELKFKAYRINTALSKTDSVINNLGKEKIEDQLEINADTLHGWLNFYLQKANSKNLATLLRFDKDLKLITKTENFESNKINSLTTFENESYTFRNSTYTIRASEDSLGKQFFLTRYDVISDQKPFEYKVTWQYPLEKRHINTTHIFYADSQLVLVYVTILSGDKKGQWILKVNAAKGTVIKGIKLNARDDERSYIFNAFDYDPFSGEIFVTGNIYTKQQFDPEAKIFTFANLNKQNTFFFVLINTDEVMSRMEKIIPITYTASLQPKVAGAKPLPNYYHVRIKELKRTSKTDYTAYCDVYKTTGAQLLFLFETAFTLNISLGEETVEVNQSRIFNILASFPNLVNTDPKDINGKIELGSITEFDRFLYKRPVVDVEKEIGKDDNKNPKWIIARNDLKSGKNSFYKLTLGAKGLENKLVLEASKYDHPNIYRIGNDKLIFYSYDQATGNFSLSAANW